VGQDKKTGLVTLGIEWADPGQAAAWANALVVRVNAELRARAVAESERSIAYLREQLHKANLEELRLALANLIKGITFAKATEEYAFKIIDPAVVPERRIKPKRALMVVLGGVLGLMLGCWALCWYGSARPSPMPGPAPNSGPEGPETGPWPAIMPCLPEDKAYNEYRYFSAQ